MTGWLYLYLNGQEAVAIYIAVCQKRPISEFVSSMLLGTLSHRLLHNIILSEWIEIIDGHEPWKTWKYSILLKHIFRIPNVSAHK